MAERDLAVWAEAEAEVLADIYGHWFIQGGRLQFGDLEPSRNADEFIVALLRLMRTREAVAEARLHALTRQLFELHEGWRKKTSGYSKWDLAADELQELLARVDTPGLSTALVPHPSLGDESTDQPVKETES